MKYTILFTEKLHLLEKSLAKWGYSFAEVKEYSDENFSENVDLIYRNDQLKITFSYSLWGDPEILIIGVSMLDLNSSDKSFFLNFFVKDHGLEDRYSLKSLPGASVAEFFQAFFSELEVAFETYLNDQLSGKVFHNHKNAILDSFYNNSNMYEKIVEIIDEHHDNNSTLIGWIKWKITRFKMKLGLR